MLEKPEQQFMHPFSEMMQITSELLSFPMSTARDHKPLSTYVFADVWRLTRAWSTTPGVSHHMLERPALLFDTHFELLDPSSGL